MLASIYRPLIEYLQESVTQDQPIAAGQGVNGCKILNNQAKAPDWVLVKSFRCLQPIGRYTCANRIAAAVAESSTQVQYFVCSTTFERAAMYAMPRCPLPDLSQLF